MEQWNKLPRCWQELLYDLPSHIWQKINHNIIADKNNNKIILPHDVFYALKLTKVADIKVIIIGQDPYHNIINNIPQAHGLAFSVPKSVPIPPSLRNIDNELFNSLSIPYPNHGCLEAWAQQGVLLLNSILTVIAHQAASHANIGWQEFTDFLLYKISVSRKKMVWLLWGNYAISKRKIIEYNPSSIEHLVLTASHPSPLSAYRGFLGCNHFVKANDYLVANNITKINWLR